MTKRHTTNMADLVSGLKSTTGDETNDMWRAVKADRKARLDAEEPQRIEKMRTVCPKLGVAIRQLTPYQFRLTYKERWVDYCPRTRKVTYKQDHVGIGLRDALVFLGVPAGDRES